MASPESPAAAARETGSADMHVPTAAKRPAVDSTSERATKRRSTVACLSCRTRKVRCDVVACGSQCTNCRLDGVPCVVKDSNRGKRPSAGGQQNTSTATSSPPPTHPQQQHQVQLEPIQECLENRPSQHEPDVTRQSQNPLPQQQTQTSQPQEQPLPSSPLRQDSPSIAQTNEYLVTLSFEDQPPNLAAEPNSENHTSRLFLDSYGLSPRVCTTPNQSHARPGDSPAPASSWSQSSLNTLPAYFRPLPRHVGPDDLDYLRKKGALAIPDDEFRDELLRTYVKVVHPFMPTLDLEEFLVPIISGQNHGATSFLIFQAVMFASVTFVDIRFLRARGFSSRKAARKTFFNRVRLLYNLDCEPNRLLLIQALLLMTYWYDTPEDEKDTWYWMGITISLGQIIGIHRHPNDPKMDTREKQLRIRIWWSCFMRDRLLALGIRRPIRIREKDHTVSMLTLDDFNINPPSEEIRSLFQGSDHTMFESDSRSTVALMCIELAKLCICLGRILHTQYSVLGDHPNASGYFAKVVVIPKQSEKQAQKFGTCDLELETWFQNQHRSCRYTSPGQGPADMVSLHRALLYMIYLTTLSALHRPQVFRPQPGSSNGSMNTPSSRRKVTEAAIAMTKLAYELQCHDQLRYLSTSSIPAFLSATLIHLLDIRNPEEDVRNVSIGRFYQCLQALHQLRDMYASADYAIKFLHIVLESIKVRIPMLSQTAGLPSVDMSDEANRGPAVSPHFAHTLGGSSANNYPTPTSNRNLQPPALMPTDETTIGLDETQRLLSPLDSFEYSTPGATFYSGIQPAMDTLPSGMFNWGEYDSLLPGLLNFDPGLFTDSTGTRPSVIG